MSKKEQHNPSWFSSCRNALPATKYNSEELSPKKLSNDVDEKQLSNVVSDSKQLKNQPGGWKSMPFILGNETFERLAAFGLLANFMVYLKREYHLDQVYATNLINIYSGVANFAPLLGAFISDAYVGRFWAIAFGSVAAFLGMVALTLTAWLPTLKPSPCPSNYQTTQGFQPGQLGVCEKPTGPQMGFLALTLCLLCIGTAGIRPCSLPFGVNQFDHTTEEGRRGINSYYNWYYTTLALVLIITLTVVVYIQDSVSWILGFGIPTTLMFFSIILFFLGRRLYVYVKPEGSVFSSIFRVFVAWYHKRRVALPEFDDEHEEGVFYDPLPTGFLETKLPSTNQYSFLNKAAIIQEGEVDGEGKQVPTSKWRLCSIQEIEEVKCLMRVLPIWASGIICFTSAAQQSTFTISQALTMNRRLGPSFQIPPGSISIVSMITVGIWVPIYDRLLVPRLRKITNHVEGISLLQRMGIGLVFSILSMVVAGLVEQKRRNLANLHHEMLSIAWLIPQLVLLGFAEGFNFIGQIEFYNKQFPEKLGSVATSLFFCTVAGANYLSSAVVSWVHALTGGHGRPDWLTDDINQGRVDYFYYLLAIMGCFNMVYFVAFARKYHYKGTVAEVKSKDFEDHV